MFKYFISVFMFMVVFKIHSQEKNIENIDNSKDSIVYKSSYGLRIGLDISKPILGVIDSDYNGIEIVADYRIKKNLYLAAEIGIEEQTTQEDFTNSTSKGSYIRLGINANVYKNWLDMNNEVFVGYRYGLSLFDQTLNSYTPNVVTGVVNDPPYFPADIISTPITTSNLNAHWSEFVLGFKAETLQNLFVSVGFSYKIMMSVKEPDNFKSLYAPGFNRIFETSTGFGFNYTISYLIPFSKK